MQITIIHETEVALLLR